MVSNGGMELLATDTIPLYWNINHTDLAESDTEQGDVHSGNRSVRLSDGAVFWQDIDIEGGCYFELNFFARGNGSQVQLEACVIFYNEDDTEPTETCILIRSQDIPTDNRSFSYYRFITAQAPENAYLARIEFRVTANGNQSLLLDDVSFSVN